MNLDTTHSLLMILATTLGGGVGVHLFANVFKKLFKLKSSAVIHTMVVALASVAAGLQYVQQIHAVIPPVILGISGPAIYGFSQIIYRYVGYASDFLSQVRAYNESLASTADAEVAAVNPPADITAEEPPVANF